MLPQALTGALGHSPIAGATGTSLFPVQLGQLGLKTGPKQATNGPNRRPSGPKTIRKLNFPGPG